MEYWDIYDIDRHLTDKKMIRGEEFTEGAFHLVVHVCIFNSENKMLIQQHQSFKDGWPNLWDVTCGGSAVAGDDSRTAAQREIFEEMGISFNLKGVKPHLTVNYKNGFDDFYLVEAEINIADLHLQYEEVQNAKWATEDDIIKMIEDDMFIPYYPSFISFLFNSHKHYGTHMKA